MVQSELRGLRPTHQSSVSHKVSHASVEMGGRVIDVLSFLYADEIRYFRRVIETAVPSRKRATTDTRCKPRVIIRPSRRLQLRVGVIRIPGHTESQKEPCSYGRRHHLDWRAPVYVA